MHGIGKSFGGVAVLADVELVVQPGEVMALLGSNGTWTRRKGGGPVGRLAAPRAPTYFGSAFVYNRVYRNAYPQPHPIRRSHECDLR